MIMGQLAFTMPELKPKWWNWQTRNVQGVVPNKAWGFDSPFSAPGKGRIVGLVRRFAKPLNGVSRSEGSNPSPSATKPLSEKQPLLGFFMCRPMCRPISFIMLFLPFWKPALNRRVGHILHLRGDVPVNLECDADARVAQELRDDPDRHPIRNQ